MARRPGGVGRRRIVPGIRAGLIARKRSLDATFCLRNAGRAACGWCEDIAALESGEVIAFSGDMIWRAARPTAKPNDLVGDTALYLVIGADVIEGVDPA